MSTRSENLLLAVDPSLTCSGWALFSISSEKLVSFGTLQPPGTKFSLAQRLAELQLMTNDLLHELSMRESDFLVCEGPAQLVLNPQSSLKVEQVRSIFESVARTNGISVPGRLNPRTVQTELLGMKGPQLKRENVKQWARATVERLFAKELAAQAKQTIAQDCIDAILIGVLASSRIKSAWRTNTNPVELFAEKHSSAKRNGRGAPRFNAMPALKQRS